MTRPERAMVLAAGLGTRMMPLTEALPKPLIPIAGRPLIDHALGRLAASGIAHVVVNTHYLAERLAAHLAGRTGQRITVLHEPALLGTGGGVANALPDLAPDAGDPPFFVANADALWRDGPVPALDRLAAAWDETAMDALLLLVPRAAAVGMAGAGDFHRAADGRLRRRTGEEVAPCFYAGMQLVHRRLFDDAPDGAFSVVPLWDRAAVAGRLFGLIHDGAWFHVGTPAAVAETEAALAGTAP